MQRKRKKKLRASTYTCWSLDRTLKRNKPTTTPYDVLGQVANLNLCHAPVVALSLKSNVDRPIDRSSVFRPCRRQRRYTAGRRFPGDLLREILARLPWSSHPSFAATCTHWRTIVTPFYPAWLTPVLLNAVDVGCTNVRYYSPYHHKIFEVDDTLESPDAKICYADGHHLTLCFHDGDELIVSRANLVTGFIEDLPPLERSYVDFLAYDGEDMMFRVNAAAGVLEVAPSIKRDGDWLHDLEEVMVFSTEDGTMFKTSPMTNPVLHHGMLYMLAEDGRLAVYNECQHDDGFKILDKPVGFGFECDDFYLLESDEGELMAVLADRRGSPLHVVKLNEGTMEWETVESLEGRALFTGTLKTMMVKTHVKWMQNKVVFPRLYHWPDIVSVDLIDREGELAFVPKSTMLPQDGGACGKSIWTCELGQSAEFWGTTKLDYGIWVNFKKLTP